jgi:YVTN family beta-propeller protein
MHPISRSFRSARLASAVVAFATILAAPLAVSGQGPYKVIDHWKLGGDGGWDYLLADSSAHRLYVTHGPRVEVIDTQSGKPVGAITGLHGTHGIALDNAGKFGYISDGGGNAVVVFDRSSLETVATIPVGTNPDGIIFEPATQTVWAFNGRSKDVSVVDAASRKVVATIALPGKPEFPAVDGQGIVFDNIEDKNSIVRLDAHTKTLTATWPIGCESPSGLAFDVAGHRLFSVCDGKKMAVTDSETGKPVATPAIGDGPDAANYSATKGLAFASCGEGVLSVVNTADPKYASVENLKTERGARTMTYDSATDRAYLVTAQFGPPPASTPERPHPRPSIVPDSFEILVVGR